MPGPAKNFMKCIEPCLPKKPAPREIDVDEPNYERHPDAAQMTPSEKSNKRVIDDAFAHRASIAAPFLLINE